MNISSRSCSQEKFFGLTKKFQRFCSALLCLTLLFSFIPPGGINIAEAATFSITKLTSPGAAFKASDTNAVLKITFGTTEASQNLTSVKVTLEDMVGSGSSWTNGAATSSDLLDLAVDGTSGIALYKDDASNGTQGTYEAEDDVVTLVASPVYVNNTFTLTPDATTPISDGDIYYVVLKTKAAPTNGHEFKIKINAQDDIVTSGTNPTIDNAIESDSIRIDTAAPTLMSAFAWDNPNTTVEIFFSEPVLKSAIECSSAGECANIYTISGSIAVNSASGMGQMGGGLYADGAQLTLASGATNGTTTITLVDDTIPDQAGNVYDSTGAVTLEQKFPPMIKGVKLVNSTTAGVVFDRPMDSSTTNVTARYTFQTAAADTETVTSATLQGDNVTVNVVASGATIADGDTLIVNQGENIQDDNGNPLPAPGAMYFQIDGTKPQVAGATTEDNASGNDYVYVRFTDRMDWDSAQTSNNYTPNAGSITNAQILCGGPEAPSWMTPEMCDKVVKLTTPDVTAITTSITVSTNVTDQAGNVMETAGNANVASLGASATTAISISDAGVTGEGMAGSWNMPLDGCMESGVVGPGATGNSCTNNNDTNRDTIHIPFTGAIDVSYLGESSDGAVIPNIGSYLQIAEFWQYGSQQSDCATGDNYDASRADGSRCEGKRFANLADSYGRIIDNEASNYTANSNGIDNDVLVVYLQGWTDINQGMKVDPSGIKGMNGLSATQNTTETKNRIPFPQFTDVEFVKSNDGGNGFGDGDTVTLFFGGDMTRTDLDDTTELAAILKPSQMMPWQEHSWGTGGSLAVAWGNYSGTTCTIGANDGNPDCLKITLGGSTTVVDGDEIMIQGNLTDSNGLPIGFGGKIDVTAPTATATKATGKVYVNFSEMVIDQDFDDPADWTDNFSLDSGTITAVTPIFDGMSGTGGPGMMDDMAKKFEITVDSTASTTQVTVIDVTDEGGNALASATLSTATDSVGPTLGKVVQNDWNGDGVLNAWDEIIFIFDNEDPADPSNGLNGDVDFTTITNVNTDFIIKRNGSAVTNPFGQGVNTWIDMWDRHAGEFHINLGQGADIQSGDEIWVAQNEVKDLVGNAMDHSSALYTLSSAQGGEISRISFNDVNTDGDIDVNDQFIVHFNTAIDPYSLGNYDGSTVGNLDWALHLDHNFDNDYGSTYAFEAKTWGDNATATWDANFDALTITVANNFAFGDGDMVMPSPEIRTDTGGSIRKPGQIDLTRPTLLSAIGNATVTGDSGTFEQGDKIILEFSESMNEGTVLITNLGVGGGGNLGGSATITTLDTEERIFEVTLGSSPTVNGSTTFDPTDSVLDRNGNKDNTASAVTLSTSYMPTPTNLSASDTDTTNGGIDGRDFTATWTAASGATSYSLYLLPDFVPADIGSTEWQHKPVAIVTSASACTGASCTFTGTTALIADSRSTASDASIDPDHPLFPLNEFDPYVLYMTATDGSATSFPARITTAFQFSKEYSADGRAPWVEGTMPWDGAMDIPTNGKRFNIKFNEQMDRTSIETSGNIVLEKESSGTWTGVTAYVSYDDGVFSANIEPAAALDSNTRYRMRATTNVTDAGGTALENSFEFYFTTSATTDTTGPQVQNYFFDGSSSTTDVPRNTFAIAIEFNEDMDPSSFTTSSVTLTPAVGSSDIWYDPMMRSMNYVLGGPLEQNTEYTLTLSGIYVKDAVGNTLDGDSNGTADGTTADSYTLTFTTANSALSTAKPTVNWIDCDLFKAVIGFSEKMEKSTVEDKSNWRLTEKNDTSVIIDLQTTSFFFDGFMNELRIEGLTGLSDTTEYRLLPTGVVKSMNGQAVDKTDLVNNHFDFTPWDPNDRFDASNIGGTTAGGGGEFNGDMFAKMANDDFADDKDFKMFMPVNAWPMNPTEGKTTNYHIGFPTTQAIVNGGQIVLEFPTSFDVSGATIAVDPQNNLFFFNQDVNGPGGTQTAGSTFNELGKVQIVDVSANNQTKKITLTLAVDDGTGCTLDMASNDETPVTTGVQNTTDNNIYGEFMSTCTDTNQTSTTMPFDYLDFELSGIKNGSASEVVWTGTDGPTGGYQIEITTKNSSGKVLEGPIKTMQFPIKEAGNGSVSGKVTGPDGATGVASVRVFLDSPMIGHQETSTDSNGDFSFTQLSVPSSDNEWEGWYHLWVEAPMDSDYFGGGGADIHLTASNPSSTGNNFSLSTATNTVTITINHTGDTLDGAEVEIWAAGPSVGWKSKNVTLDADGSTETTLKVPNGMTDFGLQPYFEQSMFGGGGTIDRDFMPPKPIQKNITGNDTVTIALTTADQTITGVVTDGTAGLANVNVYAYDPSGEGIAGGHTMTATDGSYILKITDGTYNVGVHKPGLPVIPEKTVTVASDGTITKDGQTVTSVDFSMRKSDSSISGTVTDGTNAIQYASINAWTNEGEFASTMTDSQGSYTLFVSPGTWSVEAVAPGYGQVPADSGVDTTDFTVADGASVTGKNFSVAQATYYLISGKVKDSSNNGISDIFVNVDERTYAGGIVGDSTGNGNGAKTDSNGDFSIRVPANTAGTTANSTRYVINIWSPEYGEIKPDSSTPIDVSSANSTGNDATVSAKWTATINLSGGQELDVGTVDITEAFVDIFSPTNNTGNHRRFKDIDVAADGTASLGTIDVSQSTGYSAMLHIPGIGEFSGKVNGNTSFPMTSNQTIVFNLGLSDATSMITISGTVKDDEATPNNISDAWVHVINTDNFNMFGDASADDGTYSLKVPAGTYTLRVDKPGYKSPTEVTIADTDTGRVLTMIPANSSISGIIYQSDGSTPVDHAFVWAEEINGPGWVGGEADSDGVYSLPVPSNTNWKLFANNDTGNMGSKLTSTAAGASGVDITLSSQISGAGFIAEQPKTAPMTPAEGGRFDDAHNTGVRMNIPANALGTGTNSGQIVAEETSALPKTSNIEIFGGIGKEITATDADGQPIVNLNSDVTLDLVYTKAEVESFAQANDSTVNNGLGELEKLENAYWDATTQSWIGMSTTKTVQVKNDSADANWTTLDFDTFFDNVTGDGDNTANGGGTQSDYYDNYKITFTSTTDHFTIFGTTNPTDGDAPDAPTGLATSPSSGSVALSWNANSEADLLEYQVFRGTSTGFTCDDDSQINTSAVTTTSYTDSTVGATYTYYYKLTAVDTSGNISNCTSAVSATYATRASTGGSASTYSPSSHSSSPLSTAYSLPRTQSLREIQTTKALNLDATDGKFTRPVVITSVYGRESISIKKDTQITDENGNVFAGVLMVPETLNLSDVSILPEGFTYMAGVKMGSLSGVKLHFSKPYTLTIPVSLPNKLLGQTLKVYNYENGAFELAGDGGRLNDLKTAMVVNLDHMSTFVVLNTNGNSMPKPSAPKQLNVGGEDIVVTRQIPAKLIQPVPPFKDVRGHWAKKYISELRERGVVSGKSDGIFDPGGNLTRAELTKVALNAFQIPKEVSVSQKPFKDVNKSEWYAPYIAAAKKYNVINGYPDGTFKPNNSISRVEALKVILEGSGLDYITGEPANFVDTESGAWYDKYVSYADKYDLIDGFAGALFKPSKPIVRSEMARMIVKIWELMSGGVQKLK